MQTLLTCVFEQLLFSIGAIGGMGFLIAWLNRRFYGIPGMNSARVCLVTGAIGTPIHELGHAFFCVVFGHRIVEIKLFRPNAGDGTLGYVSHTWNHKSFYQSVGNFFIGVGPILFGSGVLSVLMWLLAPETFRAFAANLDSLTASTAGSLLAGLPVFVISVFADFFSPGNWLRPLWWIYTILACFIALHVNLSKPDIEHAKPGALLLAGVIVVPNFVLAIAGDGALLGYHRAFVTASLFVTGIMLLCAMFSIIAIGAALLAVKIGKRLR